MKRIAVAAVTVALLGAAGCGSDDSGGSTESGPSDEEQIQAVAENYSQAALDGDAAAACDLFSEAALEELNNSEEFESCEEVVETGFGILDDSQKKEIAEISNIQVDGDTATAEGRDGEVSLVRENGEWKLETQNGE